MRGTKLYCVPTEWEHGKVMMSASLTGIHGMSGVAVKNTQVEIVALI